MRDCEDCGIGDLNVEEADVVAVCSTTVAVAKDYFDRIENVPETAMLE